MSEQPFTLEPGSGTKLLTAEGFIELLIEYADNNLDTIAKFWAMPGEGWEDSFRTGLAAYIERAHPWADLGEPGKRQVYTTTGTKPKVADFVLNGTVARYWDDEVIVEVKTQSLGRLANFRGDFQKDIAKLDEVDDNHLPSQRLAVGIFFTRDFSTAQKDADEPLETPKVSMSFTKWLEDYDHVYLSEEYKAIRRSPGKLPPSQIRKAGAIRSNVKPTDVVRTGKAEKLLPQDVHELGIVYKLLGPKRPPAPEPSESSSSSSSSESEAESSDSVFQTKPTKKRKAENTGGKDPKRSK
ncbi:hypothetical protein MF672_005440 [Actinomadura sp. ATCC 31491]|uniref:Restriction endonuclease n=2 Tax=Actinomadura luzonensis TaxID=2805427 RepID=A0ABT0FMH6_9ACTN|nr:hypothetical protein [Actinomadura luzonensis]